MRITITKVLTFIALFILVVFIWLIVRELTGGNEYTVETCQHSEQFISHLHDIAFRVHSLLVKLDITHFLCYATLWGQIRSSKNLPWESKVDMCILNEELSLIEEAQFYRTFSKNGLDIRYYSTDGVYEVKDASQDGTVRLYVFELNLMSQMYRRVGWKRRVLPPDCKMSTSLECFPPRLITPPLPKKEFGGYIFPVPREGIEIQKYHYEHNWWKDIKPKNC